ncbi:unnamed protein product [Agarophyton chilense]|eukprot:gb/GEZJ01004927.1/.p1 GENE.gb/GEZJ01004927.1/~~gb/GEZJ01004927.1/.p1  ORF type:complete len:261 (-),score=17.63 gb/GEZJ01004927.1/:768-1550(-)
MLPALQTWTQFMLAYHSACLLFQVLDQNNLLQRHKAFRSSPALPSYGTMLPRVLFNQICIMLPTMLAIFPYIAASQNRPEPSPFTSWLALCALAPVLHEIPFYLTHRFVLHSPRGVARFGHSLHHSAKAHSAISAMYMYSFDFVLEIVLPYVVPLFVLRHARMLSETHANWLLILGSLGGLYEHSGYNFFPNVWSFDTRIHAMHHIYYSCSFADGVGAPSLLDNALRTVCGSVGAPPLAARKLISWFAPNHSAASDSKHD